MNTFTKLQKGAFKPKHLDVFRDFVLNLFFQKNLVTLFVSDKSEAGFRRFQVPSGNKNEMRWFQVTDAGGSCTYVTLKEK